RAAPARAGTRPAHAPAATAAPRPAPPPPPSCPRSPGPAKTRTRSASASTSRPRSGPAARPAGLARPRTTPRAAPTSPPPGTGATASPPSARPARASSRGRWRRGASRSLSLRTCPFQHVVSALSLGTSRIGRRRRRPWPRLDRIALDLLDRPQQRRLGLRVGLDRRLVDQRLLVAR